MKLRHVILVIMLGGAAGILCVWHNSRLVGIERRITQTEEKTRQVERDLQEADVELANLRRIENLELLAEQCRITEYLHPPVEIDE